MVDWIDEVSQNAQIQNYNLSISGNASDKVNYYLSAGYMKQDGLIVGDVYKKLTFMAKMDAKVTDWLTVGMRASYYNASNPGQIANIQSATWLSPIAISMYVMMAILIGMKDMQMEMSPARFGVFRNYFLFVDRS